MEAQKSSDDVTRISPFADFFKQETSGSILILIASVLGLLAANSIFSDLYFTFLSTEISIKLSGFEFSLDIQHVINDGLMTIFFFLVGLEIKRELTSGHLASFKKAIVPFLAAIGGMIVPAFIFLLITDFESSKGWAIPIATDIALAVAVLGYFGAKQSGFLRPFLLGLAVIDDIGAILIIAFLFSKGFALNWFIFSIVMLTLVLISKYFGIKGTFIYIFFGIGLWLGLYNSGIHPTLAGVILGLIAPVTPFINKEFIDLEELKNISSAENVKKTKEIARNSVSVVEWLEYVIHPWSAFLVVPIFAFANTGVVINASALQNIFESKIAWGIMVGLVLGKPLGVLFFTYATKYSKIGQIPDQIKWTQILGVGNAAGIGFTVAIFIAKLAFEDRALQDLAILSVLIASVVSALIAVIVLKLGPKNGVKATS